MKNVDDVRKFRTELVELMRDAVLTISIDIRVETCFYYDGNDFNEKGERVKIEDAIVFERNYKRLLLDINTNAIVIYKPYSEKKFYKNVDMFFYEDYKNKTSLLMALTRSIIEFTR